MMLEKSIDHLKGVGPKTKKILERLSIFTIDDLLSYYPRTYDVYKPCVKIFEAEEQGMQSFQGEIVGNPTVISRSGMQIIQVTMKDDSGIMKLTWFRMPYLKSILKHGTEIIVRGKCQTKSKIITMEQPELFLPISNYEKKMGHLQPIYPLTTGLSNNTVQKLVQLAMESCGAEIVDHLPSKIKSKYNLISLQDAINEIHFPRKSDTFTVARNRLVFDEFLTFIINLQSMKEHTLGNSTAIEIEESDVVTGFINSLPYQLTNAQHKVWREIQRDMKSSSRPMSRLIQGDVGSGKTIVALLALLSVVDNGYQGAMMAPTEVLAKQHHLSIMELLKNYNLNFRVVLLTGSMKQKEKRIAYQKIESGEADIIVGTHALIQEKVAYQRLALVITDEQHRFGVNQRKVFSEKGESPHVLIMSATPIPRTLGIILYGDLDISVIDELPSNRLPIKNCVVDTTYRPKAYNFMEEQVSKGRQCYVVCSMVEESEHIEAENVVDYTEQLRCILGDTVRIAYIHGKMKQQEKDELMAAYHQQDIDILVSTTVIEVGINVPNATVMLIENAERFGLAGLHQLRGRVGRGVHQSYCIFMTGSKSKDSKKRLEILGRSNDGFEIANEDLKLRGPGDLFGIRQSGLMNFKIGDVYQDAKILKQAAKAVSELSADEKMKIMSKNERNSSVIL